MEKSVLDMTDRLKHQKQGLKTSEVRNVQGIFVVMLRSQKVDSHFLIHNYVWMKMVTISIKNWVIWNTREQWENFMILVGKTVITILLMFLCLVMDVVCLSILKYLLKINISIWFYHIHIWDLFMLVLDTN